MSPSWPLSSLRACPDCGLICAIAAPPRGFVARCARCGKTLRRATPHSPAWALASAITGFIFYAVILSAPFLEVVVYGRFRSSTVMTGVAMLGDQGLWALAGVVLLTAVLLPFLKLAGLLAVFAELQLRQPPRWVVPLFRNLKALDTWAMVEIYLLGFLVAYTRLQALATVHIETAIFALIGLALSMVSIDAALEPEAVWDDMKNRGLVPALNALPPGRLTGCHLCRQANAAEADACARCGAALRRRKPDSIARTLALTIAALILYVPANAFPVMRITSFGHTQPYTIWRGVVDFAAAGLWPLALLVFTASIAIPVFKLAALGFMLLQTRRRSAALLPGRARLYRFIDFIGRWSMIDVFMLSILVGLMRFGNLVRIAAGPGAAYFAAVVILTLFAVAGFDPRLMWDAAESARR